MNLTNVLILLEKVRAALRLTTHAYDEEIKDTIVAAYSDLGIAGVVVPSDQDPLVMRAVITYCKLHVLTLDDGEYDRMKRAYDEQKSQLSMATGYTNWGDVSDES